MYVCVCNAVTDRQIKQAVNEGACSLRQLQLCLQLGTTCGKCMPCAREVLDQTLREAVEPHSVSLMPRLALAGAR